MARHFTRGNPRSIAKLQARDVLDKEEAQKQEQIHLEVAYEPPLPGFEGHDEINFILIGNDYYMEPSSGYQVAPHSSATVRFPVTNHIESEQTKEGRLEFTAVRFKYDWLAVKSITLTPQQVQSLFPVEEDNP